MASIYGVKTRLVHQYGRNRGQASSKGVKVAKPPRGAYAADEDYAMLYSGNILYDPGFELFIQNAAPSYKKPQWYDWTGAEVYALPRMDLTAEPTGQRWFDGSIVDPMDISQWSQMSEPYVLADNIREGSFWQVVRREAPGIDWQNFKGPMLGIHMARWYDWTASARYGGNGVPGTLLVQGPGMPPGYSCRVEDGALITWAIHSWVTRIAPQNINLSIRFFTKSGSPVFATSSNAGLSLNKNEYVVQSYTPGGSYFLRAMVSFSGVGHRDTILAVDTARLGVE